MPYKNRENQNENNKKWYSKNKERHIKNKNISRKKRADLYKKILISELGGKCSRCGYDEYIEALQFHHVLNKMDDCVSSIIIQGYSLERARKEAKRCILLCANCHCKEHFTKNKETPLIISKRKKKTVIE